MILLESLSTFFWVVMPSVGARIVEISLHNAVNWSGVKLETKPEKELMSDFVEAMVIERRREGNRLDWV